MEEKTDKYSLVVLSCCFVLFFMMIGMVNSPSGLFIVPVSEHFGFSRSAFSLTISLSTLTCMVINLCYGKLYRYAGIKKMISAGFIAVVVGFLILSRAESLPVFYLGGILTGMGMGVGSSTTISILINSWFSTRQGLLLGVCSAGSGLGGFLFSRIFVDIIENQGYQQAYFLTAICLAIIAIPLIVLIKEKPREAIKLQKTTIQAPRMGYFAGFKKLLREKSSVRWTLIAAFTFGLIAHAVLVATPGHLQVNGLDPVFAGTIYGAVYFALAGTKILIGWVDDRFGTKAAAAACLISFALGTLMLIFCKTTGMAWAFVAVFSISVASQAVLAPLLAKNVLGKKSYREYLGMYVAAVTAGISLGVPIINVAYDIFGTYVPVMLIYIAIGIFVLIKLLPQLRSKAELAAANEERAIPAPAQGETTNKRVAFGK